MASLLCERTDGRTGGQLHKVFSSNHARRKKPLRTRGCINQQTAGGCPDEDNLLMHCCPANSLSGVSHAQAAARREGAGGGWVRS
ncbi:hypothetical protein [Metapseudomonas otitidis]|uniref:hypothetical protein n=1 Tax=Metapseudomonas otitidis TaxID=319939 RepID=UPI00366A8B33